MGTIIGISIDFAVSVLRVIAAVLTGAALLCWARVSPKALAAGLAVVMGLLIVEINAGWLKHLDTSIESWIRPHRSPGALAIGKEVWIHLSDPVYFPAAVVACGMVFSWRARCAKPGVVLVAAVGATFVLEKTLKAVVERATSTAAVLQDRPGTGATMFFLHSFPSGHVSVIGVFLGTVAVLLGSGRPTGMKIQLAFLVATCALFIGIYAVYIRAHTATDVLGGMVLAGLLIATAASVPALTMRAARRHPAPHRYPVLQRYLAGVSRPLPARVPVN